MIGLRLAIGAKVIKLSPLILIINMLLFASSKIFQPNLIFPSKAGALAGLLVEVLVGYKQ